MKNFLQKYGHGFCALYIFIYLPWFFYLENRTNINYSVVHCSLDNVIPFCEYFIIPYILWFLYIVATCVYMFFKAERGEFYRFALSLITGMTLFLIISHIYPTSVNIRPQGMVVDNIFTWLISGLHGIDTSTNVFPSIHVFNSIVACVALEKNHFFKKFKKLRIANIVLCISICLSTVFLKQHSIIDVIGGIALYLILYIIIYVPEWKFFKNKEILIS